MKWVNGLLGLLAFAAVGTWLTAPGFIFLLDYVTGPTAAPIHSDATGLISGIPVQVLVQMLALFVPSAAITKILILFALLLTGISSAHLAYKISHSQIIALACGMLFMLNPFVCNRIFMGHIYLLFGYALMPLLLMLILRYIAMPSQKKAIAVGATIALIILTSIHYIALLPIIILAFVLQYRKNISTKISVSHIAIAILPAVAVCASILISAWHTPTWTGHTLQDVPASLFSLRPYCTSSLPWDTLTLSANWRTPTLTTYPCMITPLVGIASGLLVLVTVAGMSSRYLALLYAGSIMLALTVSSIPIWNPMRDSGKFLGVAALAQILLIANAHAALRRNIVKKILGCIVIISTTIISTATIIALHKSIAPAQYPTSWYKWNTIFATEQIKPKVLFLPWHQYVSFDFTNRIAVANPAPLFFTNAEIISGDNIEIMRNGIVVDTISQNPRSKEIEKILATQDTKDFTLRLQSLVQNEKITHIMLANPVQETALQQRLSGVNILDPQPPTPDLSVWKVVPNENQ
ncbi:MAG: hypothetical protein A3C02_04150 [Candidatus Andersenbacteria bacterium RIFCSPHIGHO2_02_FULL_45_11]|uniref:Glycosyltransferase RgtA/B/C/D-like domain-containing protein n=1 Tax=Candidatus Andersenbacteria bacterium RIFCSPHIGHO2_12_FULL_45_11 TaxID=1797281 RepID=A0A1G1WZH8_9BACT|nr:MAG: hypothetical protein A2805_00585 [Candidatus Andersenbacteria bacterium RIFCSPHIGHO2_01_FULL_46_36]OGY33113.1 MAG: hypothetical protein A3D99_01490 [Candidatus Andersenbacteria bacterium RIFCSPHIGHO2_12_FULL_45_11]OGY34471.1 MAG: hypothetical protein A3C02_04150 [Candidatus Andersenbacteria bacterium RIFCSPHIGHO2_02_FULL_45_11]